MILTGYLNIRTHRLVTAIGGHTPLGGGDAGTRDCPPGAFELMQNDVHTVRIQAFDPWDDDAIVLLESTDALIFSLKLWSNHTGDPVATIADDDWDKPAALTDNEQTDLATAGWYVASLELNTDELAALLPAGTSTVYLRAQLQRTPAAALPLSSQWLPVLVLSDIVRSSDATPSPSVIPLVSAPRWYKNITTYTGGTAVCLDAIQTLGHTGLLIVCYIASELQFWKQFTGTDAAVTGAIIRPTDYHATTNPTVLKRVL